jgi:glycosyltransferase 2 family protein
VTEAGRPDRLAQAHRAVDRVAGWLQALERRLPRAVAVARVIYLPLALLLVGYIGYDAARKIDLGHIRVWVLVVAYLAALVWWVSLAVGWSTLISERIQLAPMRAWCKTQVARYLPGGIWAPVARATTVRGRMRDKATAVVAENVIVLALSLGVGAVWVSVHNAFWLPLAAAIALPTLATRWLERRTMVTRAAVVRTSGTYAIGFAAYGVTSLLCQFAVSGVRQPAYPLYVAGAACIAWAVGLVVVFAPGGVGVREVVYIWMLGGLYPHAELQAAAVVARLVTVLAELTTLAVITLPAWNRPKPVIITETGVDTLAAPAAVSGDLSER